MKKHCLTVAVLFLFFALSAQQRVHFSVDDVSLALRQLTERKDRYDSAFAHPFFAYLRNLHEKYGVSVTLYCFYELNGFSLAQCTDQFADDFRANTDWLRFGWHAFDERQTFSALIPDGGGISCS